MGITSKNFRLIIRHSTFNYPQTDALLALARLPAPARRLLYERREVFMKKEVAFLIAAATVLSAIAPTFAGEPQGNSTYRQMLADQKELADQIDKNFEKNHFSIEERLRRVDQKLEERRRVILQAALDSLNPAKESEGCMQETGCRAFHKVDFWPVFGSTEIFNWQEPRIHDLLAQPLSYYATVSDPREKELLLDANSRAALRILRARYLAKIGQPRYDRYINEQKNKQVADQMVGIAKNSSSGQARD